MAFPAAPLDLVTELYVGDGWQDISGDVRVAGGPVTIQRGRSSEDGRTPPARCSLELNNHAGDYSPRNPLGQWYGSIGRNTPIRLAVRLDRDDFARTVSNGWGSTDEGAAWSRVGAGGTVAASDWNVTPGAATQSVPTTAGYRMSYLPTVTYRDVDVAVTTTPPVSDVTGGDLEPGNIALRGVSSTDYYIARVVITSAEVVTVRLMHANGTTYSDVVTVTGLTYTGQALRVRAQAEGETLRAKVWNASEPEPFDWHVTAQAAGSARTGWVGVRDGVGAGNTNTKPVVFSHDGFELRSPRFIGEVSSWPARWDVSGNDAWVPIEASGVMRRLGQGAPVLSSALRRSTLTVDPVAYWPCEDGTGAQEIASGLPGGSPMGIVGTPTLGQDDTFDCSAPLPEMGTAAFDGVVPSYTSTGRIQLRFLLNVSTSSPPANDSILARVYTSGSLTFWQLVYVTGGGVRLEGCRDEATIPVSSGTLSLALLDGPRRVSVELQNDGSDVDWLVSVLAVGSSTGGFNTGTATSQSTGAATRVWIAPQRNLGETVIGHITVQSEITSLFDVHEELNAYRGETAAARIQRLCDENGVSSSVRGTTADSAAMGPQRRDTLLDLIQECADADLGTLYEPRGDLGIAYRTRSSLYSQDATVELDYTAGEVSTPYEPQEDDRSTRNDVTARRPDGAEARAEQSTGRMSVLTPAEGGVGRYDTRVEVSVDTDGQLPDIAGWLVHLGTVDEPRYPTIAMDLARLAAEPALRRTVLDLDVDDRVTVANSEVHSHMYETVDQLARGYRETLSGYAHRVEATCTPASPYRVLVLDDADYDRIGSESSSLTAGITSSATSVQVTTTNATELWTTAAGDYPFDVMIGGERMTVTAISGSSSPQTFTVTRAVNGVVKAHNAGTEVRIAGPVYIGL